jgi:hypothetical protein
LGKRWPHLGNDSIYFGFIDLAIVLVGASSCGAFAKEQKIEASSS